ncbi:antibiotic biosynthesis monooxygenase [Kribbella sp. NPDC050470]|uniref:antibiotic biosynthesis monooxygenase n=1 Tax=unclassified Kribbella TaxID=2644121 RepID=UPI00379D1960
MHTTQHPAAPQTTAAPATPDAEAGVGVVRIHTYAVDPDKLDEFLERRAKVIGVIRDAHPGLTSTQLVRLEDGTYTDTWRWESFPAMAAAFPLAQSPEAVAAWSLVSAPPTATNAQIIDER